MSKASQGITSQRRQSISFLSIDCTYILYTLNTSVLPFLLLSCFKLLLLSYLIFASVNLSCPLSTHIRYHLILPSCRITVRPSQLGLRRQAGTAPYIHTPYALLPTLSATIPTIGLEAVGFMPPLIAGIEIAFWDG